MKQIKYKSGLIVFFNTLLFMVLYLGRALLTYYNIQAIDLSNAASANVSVSGMDSEIRPALFGMLVLVLLNIWSILDHWVEARRANIKIRNICGASRKEIIGFIVYQYLILLAISVVIAEICIYIISRFDLFFADCIKIGNVTDLLLSFLIIAFSTGLLLLKFFLPEFKHWIIIRYILFVIQIFIVSVLGIIVLTTGIQYKDFISKFNSVKETLSNVEYAVPVSSKYPDNTKEEFDEINEYILEITDGQCFSFSQEEIALQNVTNSEKYLSYSYEKQNYYECLYVSNKIPGIYRWKLSAGSFLTEKDYTETHLGRIPVMVGNNYSADYRVGDLIGNRFFIKGILEKGCYFMNPTWSYDVYYTDNMIIIPMIYAVNDWGGAYINHLNLINPTEEVKEMIAEEMEKYDLPQLAFRSMTEQINYIKEDVYSTLRLYGSVLLVILLICCISYISMLLLLIDIRKKEYVIRMMCGAARGDIIMKIAGPVFAAIVLSNILSSLFFGALNLAGILIAVSVVLSLIIMLLPCIKLFKISLADNKNNTR